MYLDVSFYVIPFHFSNHIFSGQSWSEPKAIASKTTCSQWRASRSCKSISEMAGCSAPVNNCQDGMETGVNGRQKQFPTVKSLIKCGNCSSMITDGKGEAL